VLQELPSSFTSLPSIALLVPDHVCYLRESLLFFKTIVYFLNMVNRYNNKHMRSKSLYTMNVPSP